MAPKADWEKYKKPDSDNKDEDKIVALDEGDIQLLKTYGQGPYARSLKNIETEIKEVQKFIVSEKTDPQWLNDVGNLKVDTSSLSEG